MTPLSTVIRRWPNAEAKAWAEAFVADACAHPSVLAVVAFGAAVRTALFTTDIDLLVIYERPKPPVSGRPIEVDIRWYERHQAERFIREGQELLGWVLRHGELVCEQGDYWTSLRREWLDKMPFPSAEVAEGRAARAWRLFHELVEIGDEDAVDEQRLAALTQEARAFLIRKGVFPASRPELPGQLREAGETGLADRLEAALRERAKAYQN